MTLLKQLSAEMRQFLRMINWWVALEMLVILVLGLVVFFSVIRWFAAPQGSSRLPISAPPPAEWATKDGAFQKQVVSKRLDALIKSS